MNTAHRNGKFWRHVEQGILSDILLQGLLFNGLRHHSEETAGTTVTRCVHSKASAQPAVFALTLGRAAAPPHALCHLSPNTLFSRKSVAATRSWFRRKGGGRSRFFYSTELAPILLLIPEIFITGPNCSPFTVRKAAENQCIP